jgi:membrane protease YdiL (CAAX protease family)
MTTSTQAPHTTPARQTARTGLKVFGILMVAATLALAAIVPYSLTLSGATIPDPLFWPLVLFSVAQGLVLVAPLTVLGLWLGPKVGLGAPLLSAWIEGRPGAAHDIRQAGLLALGIGAVAGVILIIGGAAFIPWMPEELLQAPVPSWWQALLASVSAGFTEELMLRLGVLTFLVWIGTKLLRRDAPSPTTIWVAMGLAALLFGLGHLPLAGSLAPLTTMLVIRTLVLNGFAGMVFGWVYWRHGLVAAMVAHTSADIVLHVLSRLVISG